MDLRAENPDPAGSPPLDSELKGAALLSALGLGASGRGRVRKSADLRTGTAASARSAPAVAASDGNAACASGEASDIHEFAGAIAGTHIFVGVLFATLRGELVGIAYVCDGDSISELFGISGGSTDNVEYISPEGGTMRGTVSDAELKGRVRLSSRSAYDFSLQAVKPGEEAGLYVSNWQTDTVMNHTDQQQLIIARIVLGG